MMVHAFLRGLYWVRLMNDFLIDIRYFNVYLALDNNVELIAKVAEVEDSLECVKYFVLQFFAQIQNV